MRRGLSPEASGYPGLPEGLAAGSTALFAVAIVILAAVAVLLVPGNPVLDLNLRRHRLLGAVLSHAGVLCLALAFYGKRRRWLDAVAAWPVGRWTLYFVLATTVPLGILWSIATVSPAYARALLREQGLLEPVSFVLFILAAWVSWERVRLVRSGGAAYRPYQLVTAVCLLLALEEVDWLGIWRPLLGGSIGGVRVGSFHDLLNLAEHYPRVWAGLGVTAIVLLAVLWRARYLTGTFLRTEAWGYRSLPLYLAALSLGVAELSDVKGATDLSTGWIFPYRIEEPLELVGALLLNGWLLLTYARDRRADAIA